MRAAARQLAYAKRALGVGASCVLAGLLGLAAGAPARAQQGLWVGEVTVDRVSQSTLPLEDLSFDLQLSALRDGIDPDTNELVVEQEALLVPARSTWEYDASGTDLDQIIVDNPGDPAQDWRRPEHPSLPSTGSAELGFGDGGDATGGVGTLLAPVPQILDLACADGPSQGERCTVPGTADPICGAGSTCAASPLPRTPPVYFRTSFEFPPPGFAGGLGDVDRVVANLLVDDGAIIHLNGEEVLRVNMPPRPGPLLPTDVEPSHSLRPTTAVQGTAETFFVEYPQTATAQQALQGKLVTGTNWIAVELHQREFARPDPTSADPTGVASPFHFRLILHVDDTAQVRLLKDVIQLRDPTTRNLVLLTLPERIPLFSPAALVDGRPFGYRISSAAFDWDCLGSDPARYSPSCDTANDAIGMTLAGGGFGAPGATLSLTLHDPYDAPTNPFVHRYHPDHDNLDADFQPITDANGDLLPGRRPESLAVNREITLTFSASDPALADRLDEEPSPDWLSRTVGGRYQEEISGLHRTPIRVEGTFRLVRSVPAPVLNPDPEAAP